MQILASILIGSGSVVFWIVQDGCDAPGPTCSINGPYYAKMCSGNPLECKAGASFPNQEATCTSLCSAGTYTDCSECSTITIYGNGCSATSKIQNYDVYTCTTLSTTGPESSYTSKCTNQTCGDSVHTYDCFNITQPTPPTTTCTTQTVATCNNCQAIGTANEFTCTSTTGGDYSCSVQTCDGVVTKYTDCALLQG